MIPDIERLILLTEKWLTALEAAIGDCPDRHGRPDDPSPLAEGPNAISAVIRSRHTRGMELFDDRVDAGRQLARRLEISAARTSSSWACRGAGYRWPSRSPKHCRRRLTSSLVRKLGVPFQPELAFGAIGEGEVRVLNDAVVQDAHLDGDDMDAAKASSGSNCDAARNASAAGRDRISLTGRIALIVDDGIATGATAKAACQVARAHGREQGRAGGSDRPGRYRRQVRRVRRRGGVPGDARVLFAVGQGYRNFTQTSDDEVIALLDRARRTFRRSRRQRSAPPTRCCAMRKSGWRRSR